MWINTTEFRREALTFLKRGYYCDYPVGSYGYKEYWAEQLRRCIEGYSVGGEYITGDHYGYLNFAQIRLTQTENEQGLISKAKIKSSQKVVTFPDFWDGDAEYFRAIKVARKEGKHIILAKARRKGYSYKSAFMIANRYNTIRNSVTLIGAYEKKFLYPEGTMTMATNYLNFFNEYTGWRKRRQMVDKIDHKRASFVVKENGIEIEKGYKSQIIAVTFKDNPDAARGKDSTLILFEEAGAFDNLKASYMATRPTVEDGTITTGMIILQGTGGDMSSGTIDFESMFYNPEPYNLMAFDNVWDEGAYGTKCGFFFPYQKNLVGFMDSDGNSLETEALEYIHEKRAHVRDTTRDPSTYDKYVTEYPTCPKEAFMQISSNIFPIGLLNDWRNKMMINKHLHIGVPGIIVDTGKKVEFQPSNTVRPITKFPHDPNDHNEGCVVIYQEPYLDESNHVPDDLYILVNDPYAFDKTTSSISLGASYVIKMFNNYSFPYDMIVASYIGRPDSQDDYNEIMFNLARYYNAKIGFENDRGDVVGYAKRTKQLNMLKEEVAIMDHNEDISFRKLGRSFGVSFGTDERKSQGDIYLKDWLKTKRGIDENGDKILNLNYIYDIALIDELIKYNRKGNFDRVSALRVYMFYMKAGKLIKESKQTKEKKGILTIDLFK